MSRNTPPCGEPRPGLDLGVDRPGDLVAGQQLGRPPVVVRVGVPAVGLFLGLRVLGAEHVRHVVEHEPLALGVAQHPAVAADRLGDQQPAHRQRPDHVRSGGTGRTPCSAAWRRPAAPARARRRCTPRSSSVTLNVLPMPPVARTTAGASNSTNCAGVPDVAERAGDPLAVLEQPGDRGLGEDLDHRLGVAVLDARPPAAARPPSAAGCGSSPGRSGRRRGPAAGTRARRSCAG